jgi:hypothetical protein
MGCPLMETGPLSLAEPEGHSTESATQETGRLSKNLVTTRISADGPNLAHKPRSSSTIPHFRWDGVIRVCFTKPRSGHLQPACASGRGDNWTRQMISEEASGVSIRSVCGLVIPWPVYWCGFQKLQLFHGEQSLINFLSVITAIRSCKPHLLPGWACPSFSTEHMAVAHHKCLLCFPTPPMS